MKKNKLGKSNLIVSEMCFGTLVMSPLQANLSLKEGQNLIEEAIDCDVNFFDSAQFYKTYDYFANVPTYKKNNIVITSKSYSFEFESMMEDIEFGLKSIKRDYFDIFMLHEQDSTLTLKGHKPALEAIIKAKEQGKVRSIGVSTHSVTLTKDLILHPEFDVVHPIFNLEGIGYKDGTIKEQEDAIKDLYNANFGVYLMKPLGGGKLYKSLLPALNYAKNFSFKHSVAVGIKNKDELLIDVAIFNNEYDDSFNIKLNLKEKKLFYRKELCSFCYNCLSNCPFSALSKGDNEIIIDHSKCNLCGYCISNCENFALRIM